MPENLYQNNRNFIRTGDALQWRSNSVIGWAIRYFSKGYWNHTSLAVNIANYDRKFQLEALEKGITLTAISNSVQNYDGEIHVLPLKAEFDDYRGIIHKIAFEQVGKKYDYQSLFKQMFGRVSLNAEKLFCSEFAYYCWKEAGIKMNNPSGMAPRPGDIQDLGIFDKPIRLK